MESYLMWEKNLSTQRPRVDRFIPPRDSLSGLQRRLLWSVKEDRTEIWEKKHLQQTKYSKYLEDVLGLERKSPKDEHSFRAWPCAPRKKTYLSSADSVLDLPTYSHAAFPELLDWSNDNLLVAALGSNYHTWSWRSQSLISQGFANAIINVCKYDPTGEILALGTATNMVELHSSVLSKCMAYRRCKCEAVSNQICSVTALEWSPTGNSFVTGCSRGVVVSHSRDLHTISWLRVTRNPILAVRISPDTRFVAVSTLYNFEIRILTWPMLETYTTFDSTLKVKTTISWHPWRSALLGVGATTADIHAHLAIWDIPTGELVKKDLSQNHYVLDTMLFSRRTGELVVSLSKLVYSELVVLDGRFSVVDNWGEGQTELDRVRTMIFSPDGTKLATATSSEDLIIWNFLPDDPKKKKVNKSSRFSAIPVYLDILADGSSMR